MYSCLSRVRDFRGRDEGGTILSANAMIILENVSKKFGRREVVHDLSLRIKPGTTFGFLGQNGAGKTTAMKMIVGLSSPNQGRITIADRPVLDPRTREAVGYMPEAPYFYDRLTGREFLSFVNKLFPRAQQAGPGKIREILNQVSLTGAENRPIRNYSKGMKQRLGFAQALVNDPDYLFLDEPLDGLDPIGRREIKSIITKLHSEGKTIFFNSHILYDTEELCDEVGILHEGRLLYAGPVKEFCGGKSLEERFIELIKERSQSK